MFGQKDDNQVKTFNVNLKLLYLRLTRSDKRVLNNNQQQTWLARNILKFATTKTRIIFEINSCLSETPLM